MVLLAVAVAAVMFIVDVGASPPPTALKDMVVAVAADATAPEKEAAAALAAMGDCSPMKFQALLFYRI